MSDEAQDSAGSLGPVADGVTHKGLAAALEQSKRRMAAEIRRYEAELKDGCECEHQWIPVTEQMPPINKKVLYTCFIDDGDNWWTDINIGKWDGKLLNFANNPAMKYDHSDDWEPCSHWMPLPAPPDKL